MTQGLLTNDELIAALREMEGRHGRMTLWEFARAMAVSPSMITGRFGGWNRFRAAAGRPEAKRGGRGKSYCGRDVVAALERAVEVFGADITLVKFIAASGISGTTICRHCGGWSRLRESVGLKPNHCGRKVNIPQEELWDDVRRVSELIGRPMIWRDLATHGRYGVTTYRRRLGPIRDFDPARMRDRASDRAKR